jgi:hypothetical protein
MLWTHTQQDLEKSPTSLALLALAEASLLGTFSNRGMRRIDSVFLSAFKLCLVAIALAKSISTNLSEHESKRWLCRLVSNPLFLQTRFVSFIIILFLR